MRYMTFDQQEHSSYKVCFLLPQLQADEIQRHYIGPHLLGMETDLLAYDLYKTGKKTSVAIQRGYLGELMPILQGLGVTHLVVCDTEYFKTLSGAASAEAGLGYVLDSTPVKEANLIGGEFKVVYCPNHRGVFYNPERVEQEVRISLTALKGSLDQSYVAPGIDIIKFEAYPATVPEIKDWLQQLLDMNQDLTSDIEGFSLKHYDAGVGTISFAWNKHEGIAFAVDLLENLGDRLMVRSMLRQFFEEMNRRGLKLIWHNIGYDVTVLIYQLFMKDLLDTKGILQGLTVMLTQWDCTRLITYLATNSCAGNRLGLKFQAQEFAGDYGLDSEDFKDIRKIPLQDLLRYNLIDSLATWYVRDKHYDTMVADNQLALYEGLFKDSMVDIVQMQLTGMPLDMDEVIRLDAEFKAISAGAEDRMQATNCVQRFIATLNREWVDDFNVTRKKKRVTLLDAKEEFNPNSAPQLARLLFGADQLALQVFDTTKTKAPATGAETLEKVINHTQDPDVQEFLAALIEYKSVDKLITSFLPAMLAAPMGPDGWHYLFGSLNLGGTVSGRLSSSGPNLQNIPSNGKTKLKQKLAKAIKKCFRAPPGWLFVGLDFSSLEDRISALTTKDPEKLKVYTDGFDGHCLRAFSYFGEEMPGIDPSSVDSINSIADLFKVFRQQSKTPTFLLTYGGTYIGIMEQLGWDEAKARLIEGKYHQLYHVSDEWVEARIAEATKVGYVEVAFGLRVRTPLLHQVVMGTSRTPFEAQSEGRTAGNACGQSYGLLNNRAGVEFMKGVRASPYALTIRPSVHIHDAQYLMIRDDMEELLYVNEHLVHAVQWQEDPLIAHDLVKIGGTLSVFHPNWACDMGIPNNASVEMIDQIALEHHMKYCGG